MAAGARVDFYYGIGSRYSYLAATRIEALERETGCAVRWHPVFSPALIEMTGSTPFKGAPVSGQYDWSYRQRDAERWADYYGVPFFEPPDRLKQDRRLLERLALACTAAARLDRVEAFSLRLFAAVFGAPDPVLDSAALAGMAQGVGLDGGDFLTAIDADPTRATLDATTRSAHERGAFGVPTFFLGDRLYWGNDRLPLLRHRLLRQRR